MHFLLLIALAFQNSAVVEQGSDGASAPVEEVVKGRLCLRKPEAPMIASRCETVEGLELAVVPSDVDRIYAWFSRDHTTLSLGYVPADSEVVVLPDDRLVITLEIEGDPERDWPQMTTLAVGPRGAPGRWNIELDSRTVGSLREIRVPTGTWDLRINSDRHAVAALPLTRVVEESAELGLVTLDPLPQIRGTVIDREGELLPSAVLIGDNGELLATSDYFGELFYEAPCIEGEESCILPEWFSIEYPGTAPFWFTVRNRRRDLEFDTLRMAPGGTLEVKIERDGFKGPLTVEVIDDPKPYPGRDAYPVIQSIELDEDDAGAVFQNLPEGLLRLDIKGRKQGQWIAEYFNVEAESTLALEIPIDPAIVTFELIDGTSSLQGVAVMVENTLIPGQAFQTRESDASGEIVIAVWDSGMYRAHLVDDYYRAGTDFEIKEERSRKVALRIRHQQVSGLVIDGATEEPMGGVNILIEDEFYGTKGAVTVVTDEAGTFTLEKAIPGNYSLSVNVEGYMEFGGGFIVRGSDVNMNSPIRLWKGLFYRIKVEWEDGTPIRDAALLGLSQMYATDFADENGVIHKRMRGKPDRPIPFWVVPLEGSLAIAELGWELDVTVRVPQPGQKLTLEFRDYNNKRADYGHVMLSYEGLRVSKEVRAGIEMLQDRRFRSGPAPVVMLDGMAPGRYKFWAIRDFADGPWLPSHAGPMSKDVVYHGMDQTIIVDVEKRARRCYRGLCLD